jgi:hypothetical protein
MELIMSHTMSNLTVKDFQKTINFNNRDTGFGDVKDIKNIKGLKPANTRELDFFELHALFETEYQEFLTDTSDEIAKRARRLSELESFVFGNSQSTGKGPSK